MYILVRVSIISPVEEKHRDWNDQHNTAYVHLSIKRALVPRMLPSLEPESHVADHVNEVEELYLREKDQEAVECT